MPQTLQDKMIDYIAITGAALEKAEKQAAAKEATNKRVSELIPQAVEALVVNGRIDKNEKEAAIKLLSDPVKALQVLVKTAEHRTVEEKSRLGSPEPTTKRASVSSTNSAYVGARTTEVKESDVAFLQKLGLR